MLSEPCATQSSHFFSSHPATTEIYTLSLHDALPIFRRVMAIDLGRLEIQDRIAMHQRDADAARDLRHPAAMRCCDRSEEHTSELQSQSNLVCRLLLEKKKTRNTCLHDQLRRGASRSH